MKNLNLDELIPESSTIILGGKEYECKPPTVEQMLRIAELETKLGHAKTQAEVVDMINDTLSPIVDIDGSKLTRDQLTALTSFIISGTIPESLKDKLGKKKQESLKQ